MPDMSSIFLGVELRTWITGGAIVLLVAEPRYPGTIGTLTLCNVSLSIGKPRESKAPAYRLMPNGVSGSGMAVKKARDKSGAHAAQDTQRSDALVLFGVTGDLAYKMIFPALYALAGRAGSTCR